MARKVLVTGASGHLGNNLARALVARGDDVRATVRDAGDALKAGLVAAHGVTDIRSLDVRDAEGFEAAAKGVEVIFHVAATYKYFTGSAEADREMIRDAVDGAAAAVRAAAKAGVRRLVLTSSTVTLPFSTERRDGLVDETQWREDLRVPYFRAKVEAEKAAWKLANELGVTMAAILPGGIIGPGFPRRTPSTDLIETIMLGGFRFGVGNTNFPAVDVRDVVTAHVIAGETEGTGRFIVCNDHLPSLIEVVEEMRRIDGRVPRSMMVLPDFMLAMGPTFDWLNGKLLGSPRTLTGEFIGAIRGKWWSFSNARAKAQLGWAPRVTLQQSLADTMARLREMRGEAQAKAA